VIVPPVCDDNGWMSFWLELKNLFQTFELQDEVEVEQEIKAIQALFRESGEK